MNDILNDEPRTHQISDMFKASKTDIRIKNLEDTVLALKTEVVKFQDKLLVEIKDVIDTNREVSQDIKAFTAQVATLITIYKDSVPMSTVNRIFALVFILIGGITGGIAVLNHFSGAH
jgi:hypothetical protein